MSENIVIITATYNHHDLLPNLYGSLKAQLNKNFLWIIVNDGSNDQTDEVVRGFINDGMISIQYILKDNSGKSSSLNQAFDLVTANQLAVIVDDDEKLDPNATEVIQKYYDKYYLSDVGVIHFHRRNVNTGEIIANYVVDDDLQLDFRAFKASGRNADGYVAYFGYALENHRFIIFDTEKYVGPSTLMMLVGNHFKTIWAKDVLGTTEYLEGGITKQGRKLRVKNPLGGLFYCTLIQEKNNPIQYRAKYSVMGFAYQRISGKSKKELYSIGIDTNKLLWFTKLPGMLLGIYWKKKYR